MQVEAGGSDATHGFLSTAQATLASRMGQGLRTGLSQSANQWLPEPHGI